ncbi:beta strand repeat-containing protein [Microbacterium arborescens]|uniref:beta strand repeat-containing protein n=1 Tax=Microbacterium arborescens TaxID=33883 RepID=UPI0027D77068|nr:hypothetical protein [Microbacterium arborescens]
MLFEEDFENGAGVQTLPSYVSGQGVSYTASSYWLSTANCNGFITSFNNAPRPANYCFDAGQYTSTQQKAYALGIPSGDPANNRAVSTNSNGNGSQQPGVTALTPNQIEFATQGQLNLPAANRFVTFSVDASSSACALRPNGTPYAHPLLRFYLRTDAGTEIPVSTSAIDPCVDEGVTGNQQVTAPGGNPANANDTVHYGTFAANSSLLLPGTSLGIVMRNEQGEDEGNDGAFDNIRVLDATPQLDKDFLQDSVPVNGVSTLQFTVTNTAELAAKNGWQFTDTLPAGLVVADAPNIGGTCTASTTATAGGDSIAITGGSLATGEVSCTVTVDVTSTTPTGAQPSPVTYENCASNISAVVGLNLPDCATVEFFSGPQLSITKTSSAGSSSAVGDVIDYEVTVTNTGTGDFTATNSASMTDDLSAVLDDATSNNDAAVVFSGSSSSAAPVIAGNSLSWSGPLTVGESATITYSVTLTNAGDGSVVNNACVLNEDVEPGTQRCASTTTELPKLTIAKAANTTELTANGGAVDYTITVTNEGPGDTTIANPAVFTDDLSAVLDDGTLDETTIAASTGTATLTGSTLDWSGVLAAGASATVTYTVTYDDATGDQQLTNVVCLPADLAQNPDDLCREVQVPGSGLTQSKSVDPASGTAVVPGQSVTYTLSFSNTGQAPAAVDTNDDLSDVLDDATITAAPEAGVGNLNAGPIGADGTFPITGSVPVGATYTIVYTVQVSPFAEQGNNRLGNVLADPTGACVPDGCTTENPVPHLTLVKDVTTGAVDVGGVVTYSVTITNDGEVEYTTGNPAAFSDDLAGVLDDATYNDDVDASTGAASVTGTDLAWSGALAVGDSATVTYSVTITGAGDKVLANVACTPANGTDPGVCDDTTTNVPFVVPTKSSDPVSGEAVQAGQVVTYTLSWTNQGTAAGVVDSTDDLSRILDDATVTSEPVTSAPDVTATRTGAALTVTGPIAAGTTVTVTYQVTVSADGNRGDNRLANQLIPDNPAVTPPPEVVHPIGELEDGKSVDPASGTTVRPGQVLTYTLTFTNTGQADVTVDRDDVLTNVLDDADITTAPTASDPALTVSGITDGRFTVDGVLTPGQTETVTYQATVKADGARGDDLLGNFLVDGEAEPPTECVPVDGETPDCTINPVSNVTVVKSSNPASGTNVQSGQQVTYTLTFTNVSRNTNAADAAVDFTDHMENVLDDATLTGAPVSSVVGLSATVTPNMIRIVGELASGQTATITYVVTVKAYNQQGDHVLGNVVSQTGVAPICVPGSALCTTHNVPPAPPGLAVTGGQVASGVITLALVMLGLGGALVLIRRRRSTIE